MGWRNLGRSGKSVRVLHINGDYRTCNLHGVMKRHLDKMGVKSTVFVPLSVDKEMIRKTEADVSYEYCFNRIDRIFFYRKSKKIRKRLEEIVKNSSFDVIHAYTLFTNGNVAYEIGKKYKIPYVVAIRNTDIYAFLKYRSYLKKRAIKILREAKKIFFLSDSYREMFLKKYVPDIYMDDICSKIAVIPNGIDDYWLENKFEPDPAETITLSKHNNIKVMYAGDITKLKNLLPVACALQELNNEGWNFSYTIVGEVKEPEIKARLAKYDFIKFISKITKEELCLEYRKNHIFVMASLFETFGLVYAEAISQGLPVIYSEGQGFDRQFKEGVVGYHVPPSDVKKIKSAIMEVIKNYNRLHTNCLKRAEKFSWERICGVYCEIYDELTKNT